VSAPIVRIRLQSSIWLALCAEVAPWIRTSHARWPIRSELNRACPSRPSLRIELGGAIARPTKPNLSSWSRAPGTLGIGPQQTRVHVPQWKLVSIQPLTDIIYKGSNLLILTQGLAFMLQGVVNIMGQDEAKWRWVGPTWGHSFVTLCAPPDECRREEVMMSSVGWCVRCWT
jgi:hypothetical protein